ncbi:MAG: CoA transferase [Chloroflexi bacterium]|nr:CoA transferase [Chloroflexota bacterium]
MAANPLDGIRVLDFSQVVAGPYTSMLLGWLGAEVIKIESARRPRMTPPRLPDTLNCFKKSCTIDLTRPEGAELAKEIVRCSDVVVENFSPRTMKRFGLDYPVLQQIKPDLVMVSMSAFGQTGSDRDYVGLAPGFVAYTGGMHLTGFPDGMPMLPGTVSFNDLVSGLYSVYSIMAALHYREQTGQGQYVDLPQAEVAATFVAEAVVGYTLAGRSPTRRGNTDVAMAPHGCYRCKGDDKWVSIAVATDDEWQALCNVMGRPELARCERYADSLSRWKNQDGVDQAVQSWTVQHSHDEVMKILQEAGIAAGPSYNAEELLNNPHLKERDIFTVTTKPGTNPRRMVGLPWKSSATAPEHARAPLHGEHNEYVFGQLLGLSADKVEGLQAAKVLY